ncbi:MAG: DUF2723 domain-containing protein, partial [bacterium]|nr:DUF2723 domain-containing protein [bacterium]
MKIKNSKLKISRILALLVFLISFSVYVYTLNPSISAADSNEIVTTAIVLGIPHQPSYPVNTILGHLFSKIPFGTLPWRVNLLSAVLHSLTVTIIYFVALKLYRLVEDRRQRTEDRTEKTEDRGQITENPSSILSSAESVLAACAALFLAFSLEFWQFANRAEVFALNNFFGATLILIIVSWWHKVLEDRRQRAEDGIKKTEDGKQITENPSSVISLQHQSSAFRHRSSRGLLQKYSYLAKHLPDEARVRFSAYQPRIAKPKRPKGFSRLWLYLLAFVGGLAFTHHQTIIFTAPAFLFILLPLYKLWWKKGVIIKLFLCFILGALPYLSLIPMARANPPVMWGEPRDLVGVFKALTRADYGTFSPYAQNPSEIEGTKNREEPIDQTIQYFKSLNQDFTFLGLLLAGLGAFYLFKRKRQVFIFLFLGFFVLGPFFLGFANWTLESGFHQAVAKRFQML